MIARKSISLGNMELKFAESGGFKGYASVFGGVDSYDDTILAGAYTDVIDKIQASKSIMPKMFVNHRSWDIPVGKWTYIEQDSKGLFMEGEFTKGNPQADVIKAALQHGTVDGLSIGFMIGDYEIVEKDGQQLRIIKSVKELPEVSIVTYPADESARVDLTTVKSALDNINSVKDLEDFLREVGGFSKSLAMATVSRSKRIFTPGEPAVAKAVELPTDIKQIIALNLLNARAMEILK
jgi:HK97 family phage prohead protease